MVEKSDEFDEWILNHQSFPTKLLHLENFDIAYFTGSYRLGHIIYKLEFVWLCQDMEFYSTFGLEGST